LGRNESQTNQTRTGAHKMNMIYKQGYGCVFSLDEYNELTFAPLYENGIVNLNEFETVDMDMIDMDDMEVFDIRNQLIAASSNVRY
jgi:hypothetical protein